MNPSNLFWKNKNVLITGHTGFKGSWLSIWLNLMGAKVTGISLHPSTNPNLFTLATVEHFVNNFYLDIRDHEELKRIVGEINPEIVFHMAAQPLVRRSYQDPLETFTTNIVGTINILDSLREIDSVKVIIIVTTDKVYKNLENNKPFTETDILGGKDPYSASKSSCEIVMNSYFDSYFLNKGVAVASARAGNVIGGGDWSADRLIPDAIRAWESNHQLVVRRPEAIRPWQHVLEPLNGYLVLSERLFNDISLSGSFNFGPDVNNTSSVRKVVSLAQEANGYGKVYFGSGSEGPHESEILKLDTSKARDILAVVPRWDLKVSIGLTLNWYGLQKKGFKAKSLCEQDILKFLNET